MGKTITECRKNYRKLMNATSVKSAEYQQLLRTLRATQLAQGAFGSDAFVESMSARLGRKLKVKMKDK